MAQVSYGTITITDNNDIEKIYMQYAQSTSNQVAPTSSSDWSTDIPTWRQGYYIWQRTVTKMSGVPLSSSSYGDPVCLTGSTGSTGTTGRGVSSIVTTYCNYGTGTPTADYSGWSTTVPAYDSSKPNYWVKTVITYTSGTPATDTTIYKDNGITSANSTAAAANSTAQTASGKADEAWSKADNAQTVAGNASSAISDLNQYFWRKKTASTNVPAGSYVTNIPGTDYQANPASGGYNSLVQADGIYLRNGITTLSSWTGSTLTFNNPSNGSKVIELGSISNVPTLSFYNPSNNTIPMMRLSTNALTFGKPSDGQVQLTIGANGALQSGDFSIAANTSTFASLGTKIDLTYGEIYTPYFRVSQGSVSGGPAAGVYITGNFESTQANIGGTKPWVIKTFKDSKQINLASITGPNSSFIQLGSSGSWLLHSNKIHTAWYISGNYLEYPLLNEKYYDFGMNLPTSLSDKFLYIRYNTGTNLSSIYQNDTNWVYPFYIDANGNVHAPAYYVGSEPLTGGVGSIAEKIINSDSTYGKGSATQPVYIDSNGRPATTTYALNAAGAKGVVTDLANNTTSTNLPTAAAVVSYVTSRGYITSFTDKNVQTNLASNSSTFYIAGPTSTATTTGTLKVITDAKITVDGNGKATITATNFSGTASRATADSDGNTINSTYLKLSGGNVTGAVTFGSSVSVDELTAGDLVVNGNASFTNNAQFNTINGVTVGNSPKFTDNNTTYTFANGTNGFTVTPSGGTAQTVTVTPSITNNVTGSGTSGYLAKFTGGNTIGNGPALGTDTTKFLNNKGEWAVPAGTYTYTLPLAANGTRGGVQIGYTQSGKNYPVQLSSEKMYVNVPWENTTYSAGTGLSLSGTTFSNSGVIGIKGNAESNYRTGQVNLTPSHLGAVGKNDELLTTNPFRPTSLSGPYISKIDNGFYAADKRWNVSMTNISGSVANIFDGSYESAVTISAGKTSVLTMDFTPSTYFPGYPYGYILISFYYTGIPVSISGRVYCNYESHGIGWHNISFAPISDSGSASMVYRSEHQGYYNISQLEISIVGASNPTTKVTQVEIHLDRPDSALTPFLSKYTAETLYYDLTAPNFRGNLIGNVTGNVTGNVSGTASNITGTLAIANGGTGKTTANDAINALLSGLPVWSADPLDTTYFIRQDTGGTAAYGKVPATTLWNYISGKLPSWSKASSKPSYSYSEIGDAPDAIISATVNDDGVIVLTKNSGSTIPLSTEIAVVESQGANKLVEAGTTTGISVGSAAEPVYFSAGVPVKGNAIPKLNNATTGGTFYAPTAGGTADTQALVGNGATTAPKWVNISPSISVTAGTASATPKINITVLGRSGTAQSLTTASTSVYGATKLSSTSSSTEQGLAATPKLVYDSIAALDGNLNNTTPGAGKTLTAFSQTDGKISATFGNISITTSQISDFPTSMTPAAHTHDDRYYTETEIDNRFKKYIPFSHYSNMNGNNSGKYYKISINSYTGWMLNFTVKMYHAYRAFDLQISGYNYGSSHWYSPAAVILGASVTNTVEVNFGYDSDYHLWIAIPAEQYTGIGVTGFTNGYQQIDGWEDLFTITMVDGLPSTKQSTVTAYRPWYRNETVSNASNASNAINATNATYATYDADEVSNTTKVTIANKYVKKTGDTMTGTLTVPILQTGTATTNYFQSQKFRGQGTADSYYHAIDFGYASHDRVDFYEYGGIFCFHKHTGEAINSGDTILGTITTNGWEGNVVGNVTGNASTSTKATQDSDGNTITTSYLRRFPWWSSGDTHNIDDLRAGITFAYGSNHNGPTTGTVVAFDCSNVTTYTLQLMGAYSASNDLYFRNRNGDNNTWGDWRKVVYNSGTWGISISGNAATATSATYSFYPKIVAGNEIRFDVATKPSSASDLYFGYAWSDGSKDAKINNYVFDNGNSALAGIKAANFNGYTIASSVPTGAVFTDTKNTAGSTNTDSALFLIGATSQAANPQTYSHDTVKINTTGQLISTGYEMTTSSSMSNAKCQMRYEDSLQAIVFSFA